MKLRVFIPLVATCAIGLKAPAATAEVSMIVDGTNAPFAAPHWPEGGMAVDLARAAFAASPDPLPVALRWDNDAARHLSAVADHQVDIALPWPRPDCDAPTDRQDVCTRFHYSDPLLEMVSLLFTRTDGEFPFEADEDIVGKTLCRPKAVPVYDLDRPDRRWVQSGAVTLVRPDTAAACFAQLMAGTVDAVAINEFQGVQQLFALGLTENVVPLPRPLSRQSLHLVISRSHWRGTTHMYRFNAGLAEIRASGQYAEILQRHLAHFWSSFQR